MRGSKREYGFLLPLTPSCSLVTPLAPPCSHLLPLTPSLLLFARCRTPSHSPLLHPTPPYYPLLPPTPPYSLLLSTRSGCCCRSLITRLLPIGTHATPTCCTYTRTRSRSRNRSRSNYSILRATEVPVRREKVSGGKAALDLGCQCRIHSFLRRGAGGDAI